MMQGDLWEKPFHSITVFEAPNIRNGGRSQVVRFDKADVMIEFVRATLINHAENPRLPRIAYIYLCACHGEGRNYKVNCLATAYPTADGAEFQEHQ